MFGPNSVSMIGSSVLIADFLAFLQDSAVSVSSCAASAAEAPRFRLEIRSLDRVAFRFFVAASWPAHCDLSTLACALTFSRGTAATIVPVGVVLAAALPPPSLRFKSAKSSGLDRWRKYFKPRSAASARSWPMDGDERVSMDEGWRGEGRGSQTRGDPSRVGLGAGVLNCASPVVRLEMRVKTPVDQTRMR